MWTPRLFSRRFPWDPQDPTLLRCRSVLLWQGATTRYPESSENGFVALSLPSPGSVREKRSFPKIFYLYLAFVRFYGRTSGWKAGSVFPDLRGLTRRWTSF